MSIKLSSAYKTIGEVVKILNNEEPRQIKINAHTIRFWEKEFNQIKPKIFKGGRRYYDKKNIELLKKIHFLLKDKGMTISGVKKLLKEKTTFELDENINESIKVKNFRNKLIKISNLVKNLKNIK